jgi:hypothetical protein
MRFLPPGGLAGYSQMTNASKAAWTGTDSDVERRASRTRKGRRAIAKKNRAVTRNRKRLARKSKGRRKMKFGSPAWQKKYKVGKYRA